MHQTGNHERIIFAAACYEKGASSTTETYGIILITRVRMILNPISLTRVDQDGPQKTEEDMPPGVKPVRQQTPGLSRTRESLRLEFLGSSTGEYLNRDPVEILSEEKNTRAIPLEAIKEISIRRVRTDSRSSRWLSILFALYPLEPAGSRYSVDYELTIVTTGDTYVLVTPFSIPLKQVLVDLLGDRVHEIVDEYAPLL